MICFLFNVLFSFAIVVPLVCNAEVVELNDSNFEHLTQASTGMTTGSWFVLFKGDKCPHCVNVKPEFEKLAEDEDLRDKGIVLGRVDVPSSLLTSSRFSIKRFPTLLYLHRSKLYAYGGERTTGAMREYLLADPSASVVDSEFNDADSSSSSSPIPPPLNHATHMYNSFVDLYAVVSDKGGKVGELAMMTLAFLSVVMFLLSVIIVVYLLFLLCFNGKGNKQKVS